MTNTPTPSGVQPLELKTSKTRNTKWTLAVLLVIIVTSLVYIFLGIPVVDHFKIPQFKTFPFSPVLDPDTSRDPKTFLSDFPVNPNNLGLLSTNATLELNTLDKEIEEFNKKAAESSGSTEQYTGRRDIMGFFKWTLRKILDMSSAIKDYKIQMEEVKTLINAERKVQDKPKIKSSELDMFSRKSDSNSLEKTTQKYKEESSKKQKIHENLMETNNQNTIEGGSKPKAGRTRLVLFSTWVDKPEKREAHDNVLRTWRLWAPLVIPLVFTNDSSIASRARSFGWQVLREPAGGCTGQKVPLLREMFRSAMANFDSHLYAYVNGDLLLGNGMLSTIEALVQNRELMEKPLLGLINRINVDFYHKKRTPEYNLETFDSLAGDGKAMTDGSSDGFITNKLFPWKHVPNIVPGRKGVAMWLVSYARDMGVSTVDVSGTLRAVHMMATQAGNNESRDHPGSNCNHKVYYKLKIKPRTWFCGFLKCAQYRTIRVGSQGSGGSMVKVEDKSKQNHPRCGECDMDVAKLKSIIY